MENTNTQITTQKPNTPAKVVPWATATANAVRQQLERVLPKSMDIGFYLQSLTATLAIQEEKYRQCDRAKLFYAIQRCAEAGVLPDGRKAVINPYGSDAKLIIMVGGFVDKLDEAGYRVQVENVYSNDGFTYTAGDAPAIHHKIDPFGERGDYKGTYCILREKATEKIAVRELIGAKEMEKIKSCAKTKNVWEEWADEKRKAAAIKRTAKRINLTPALEKMIEIDNEDYDLVKEVKNVTPAEPPASEEPTRLLNALGLKKCSEIEHPKEKQVLKVQDDECPFGVEEEKRTAR